MAYSLNVNVSVETPSESIIQEITYDGQEIYQPPLSMSENLIRLAQKIDFSKPFPEEVASDSNEAEKADEVVTETALASTSSNLPWEGIASKIRNAATEVSVLIDVLNVAREKHYMVFDPVQQDAVEVKPMAVIYARKKGLAQAAAMLTSAAERLKASQSETSRTSSTADFHFQLLKLRQNWRLKKVSNSIIGDLSYRTAGSKFPQTGMFEVTKADDEPTPSTSNSGSPPPSPSVTTPAQQSALRVTIPTELQGVAYIMVLCRKDDEKLFNTNINLLSNPVAPSNPDMHWQQKLEAAQNVLFCKELFNQLAKEAVQLQAPIPHMVIGNQITATVLPGIQLIIGLCHSSTGEKKPSNNNKVPPKSNHDHVLEHSLHQLLREVHHKNTHHPFPHPSSGPLGPSKKRYLAGPNAADRYELLSMTKNPMLLEQIIEQAQHYFMRIRAEQVLDTIAKQIKDPMIISHWNSFNTPTQSCVRVNIISQGFDFQCRTSLMVQVLQKSFKCICKDGKVMNLSYEPQELRDLILCQIHHHQMIGVQNLAKSMGWQLLTSTPHLGIGNVEPLGNASSCILASPLGDRLIAIRCEPQGKVHVSIAHSPRKDFFSGQLVKERKWENLGGPFKEVRWDKMEGKNFLNKMELLMASLTSSS
ncbi:mediator of RNA polymerase II transcription subunit 17 [Planococcus citri]|uniref:mediator of RNA polymerase II transcription subunit 17 n=1 Tax=Planococcus citri TaxID=170843 RepID=UPI0031F8A95D